ncbi:MAG: protein kinase domain-containing protein [Planctomycetota bacterium]
MSDEERLEELFDRARELGPDERLVWLAGEEVPEDLRDELRVMLEGIDRAGDFLDALPLTELQGAQLAPGDRIDDFEILSEIGRGGMGVVFKARQRNPERDVALKVLAHPFPSPALLRRFEVEAAALARLAHPGIARVVSAGARSDGMPWMALELIPEAVDMLTWARREGLGARARVELAIELCEAVAHAHRNGVLHRDLKPGNVLVDGEGRLAVIDFGIARLDQSGIGNSLSTSAGELLGTVTYMAPEQVEGDPARVDARVDVFAAGALLYELLCGRPLRETDGGTIVSILDMVRSGAPIPRPIEAERDLGVDVRWILGRALEHEPDQRYSSMDAFADDLGALLDRRPAAAGPPTASYRARRFVGRHRLGVSVALVVAVALVTATVVSVLSLQRAVHAMDELEIENQRTLAALERERVERVRALDARDFLLSMIEAPSAFGAGVDIRVADLLDRRAEAIEAAVSSDPVLAADQRLTLAAAYSGLGLFQSGLEQAERVAPLLEELDAEQVAGFHRQRALALLRLGRPAESILASESELMAMEEAGSIDEVQRVDTRIELANALAEVDRPEDAWAILEDVRADVARGVAVTEKQLSALDRTFGLVEFAMGRNEAAAEHFLVASSESSPGSPGWVLAEHGLALVELELEEYDLARQRLEAVHEECMEVFGPMHAHTHHVRATLSAAMTFSGDTSDAVELAESVRATVADSVGAGSRTYLAATRALSMALIEDGREEDAAAYLREELEGVLQLLGPGHPDAWDAAARLARLEDRLGNALAVAEAFDRALEYQRQVEVVDPVDEVELILERANALIAVERLEEARASLDELLPTLAERVPDDHSSLWMAPNALGGVLLQNDDFTAAAAAFRLALDALEAERGPKTALVLGNLAAAQRDSGDLEAALANLGRAVEVNEEYYGPDAPPTLIALSNLAWSEHVAGECESAQEGFRELLDRAERGFPPGHWMPAFWRGNYGGCLRSAGRLEEAVVELESSLEVLEGSLGPDHSRTAAVSRTLERAREALAAGE